MLSGVSCKKQQNDVAKAFVRRRGVQLRRTSACVATLAVGSCVFLGVISVTSVQVLLHGKESKAP